MIIYLLFDDSWSVPTLLGAFSTEDKAKTAEAAMLLGHPSHDLRIQRIEVDA